MARLARVWSFWRDWERAAEPRSIVRGRAKADWYFDVFGCWAEAPVPLRQREEIRRPRVGPRNTSCLI
jgi:hypothetical protein